VSDFAISNLPALVTQASAAVTTAQEPTADQITLVTAEVKVDLRQALSFVIDEDLSSQELSDDELSALEQRRLDLIMWLLNLEQRLTPYCADFA
jgi:hypothetical protein